MAAAEVRAAWQRTANRCFVQEDAKRAPKLACCPSSSASSNQVDQIPTNNNPIDKEGYNHPLGFMPFNTNPSLSNLSPESRWWLQTKPNYEHPRGVGGGGLTDDDDRLNTSDDVVTDVRKIFGPSSDMEKIQEQLKIDNMDDSYEFLEMDIEKSKDNSYNSESSPWSSEKTEPWWRMAEGYDLASFVAQRSHDVVENCDLPCPQNTHTKKDPYAYFGSTGSNNNNNRVLLSSSSHKLSLSNANIRTREKSEDDRSKAELLDALLHSQTRARVAEKAAQQAYAEKEHILKLFFRQASHMFAYKQWFQLLQLENLYFQIKNHNNQPIRTLFPVDNIPWMGQKPEKEEKKRIREKKRDGDFGKFAIAIALGFGLVGAGLLLGWSIGWMLPAAAAI
ncbi:uncharacterized protein LOC124919461 [Impatiens glandulifera]|uniref:uncharacterized protein LOC124919461 n=1 Tax=Impatiens glandulifera TaxID=253017 RepID=UPI001FB1A045|nr:uncharacterized protein LOC124919461 [Impatiens glandulifera]